MPTPNNDPIADALDITPVAVELPSTINNNPITETTDVEKDFDTAKKAVTNVLAVGQDALTALLDVAAVSQEPRAYEVAATLMKTISDASKDLLELTKRKNDITGETEKGKNVTNNLFVGSTHELQDLLKGGKREIRNITPIKTGNVNESDTSK